MRTWWRPGRFRDLLRFPGDRRTAVLWSLRVTVAAVASYVVGTLFFPGSQPLLAPLTAMLVVQVTPVTLLASGLDRVVAVVAGVGLAVAFAAVVPLEWWSLGLLILVAISVGQLLRLRENLYEVAISGMLVLGVGSLDTRSAAGQRIAETVIGAAVGVAANLAFPPRVTSADAGRAIDGLADSLSELLAGAGEALTRPSAEDRDVAAEARDWLGRARLITHDIPQVGAALLRAEQSRRFNVRAVGRPDLGPGLRQGLEALEHSAVAVRGMFRAIADSAADRDLLHEPDTQDLIVALGLTCRQMAACIDAFGQVVRDDADPGTRAGRADAEGLREALGGLYAARDRLEDLYAPDGTPALRELHAVALSTVKRLLREMDPEERVRREIRLARRPRRRVRRRGTPPGTPTAAPEPASDAETEVLPRVDPDPPRS